VGSSATVLFAGGIDKFLRLAGVVDVWQMAAEKAKDRPRGSSRGKLGR
jgi:hypothetical protein